MLYCIRKYMITGKRSTILIWTQRDLLKREFAKENELNYVVFWKNDLSDAREYLSRIK